MDPLLLLTVIGGYFALLVLISLLAARGASSQTFFTANRNSPWYLVAFGMIGASLSGVTFISIPGAVGGNGLNQDFSYLQTVFGYLVGYTVIAQVLLPLYYRLRLTSIYTYLDQRFGRFSYKTGSSFFLLSRIIGSSFRLYLVAMVLDQFVLGPLGVTFWQTVLVTCALIWLYTFKGGIKTVVWTDTFQTAAMLLSVALTLGAISAELGWHWSDLPQIVRNSEYGQVFFWENGWRDPNFFWKQFLGGAFITIVMTGLDQDMMQKNLTCRNLQDARKNIYSFSAVLLFVNMLFLALGVMLYLYAASKGIEVPARRDQLFPLLALNHLSPWIGVTFVLGLIAAAYSSADSALTALTTSFYVDILGIDPTDETKQSRKIRQAVHLGMTLVLFTVIMLFRQMNNDSVINELFKVAGYTYGPLLGLYAFGLFSRRSVRDRWVPFVAVASPAICFVLNKYSDLLLGGYQFGFELLILNGALTYFGLWLLSIGHNKQTNKS